MADDWQVGDLALCVYDGEWFAQAGTGFEVYGGPNAGAVRAVAGIELWQGEVYLNFPDWPKHSYGSEYFRKVTPPEADEFDRETIDLMNGAPVGEPVA